MKLYEIYEEGFSIMEGNGTAHYIGSAYGETFLDACKNYIKEHPGSGEIRAGESGRQYACSWGCVWFQTLSEAQKSFG